MASDGAVHKPAGSPVLSPGTRALGPWVPPQEPCTCRRCGDAFRAPCPEQFCQRCARAMTRVLTRGM